VWEWRRGERVQGAEQEVRVGEVKRYSGRVELLSHRGSRLTTVMRVKRGMKRGS